MNLIKSNFYFLEEAIDIIKTSKKFNFKENLEISINLETYPKNKNFSVRGFSVLPYGKFKEYKVAVFSTKDIISNFNDFLLLKESDLLEINKKNIRFDLLVTDHLSIVKLSKVSKILGPRSLMPDIRYGTISNDIESILTLLKKNYVRFKMDKNNILNSVVGDISLDKKQIIENFYVLLGDIKNSFPKDCKNFLIKKIFLTSTMGKSVKVDVKSLVGY